MNPQKYFLFVLAGLLLGALSFLVTLDASYFTFPFYPIAQGLRSLSLMGTLGNIVAIILYLVISLSPLLIYFIKKKKIGDWSLIGLSLVLLFGLYRMINPLSSDLRFHIVALGVLINMAILGVLLIPLVRLLLKKMERQAFGGLLKLLVILLSVYGLVLAFELSGPMLRGLFDQLQKVKYMPVDVGFGPPNHSLHYSNIQFNQALIVLQAIVTYLGPILLIVILGRTVSLINQVSTNLFSQEVELSLNSLISLTRNSVMAVLISYAINNLIVLISRASLFDANVRMHLPITHLAWMIFIILSSQLIFRYRALKLDNELIV